MGSSQLGSDGVRVLKLFGVPISGGFFEEEEVMRKSASMGNLASCEASAAAEHGGDIGYLSDGGLAGVSRKRRAAQDRKRGVPWTEEEHRTFLAGLKKLGKGDWRGISRNFVPTRTPTQVASHAQKYFLRQINPNKKKRRLSLFDVVIDEEVVVPETGKTSSSLEKNYEADKDADQHFQNNRSVAYTTLDTTEAFIQDENASQATPALMTNRNNVLNSFSFNLTQVGMSGSKDRINRYLEHEKLVFLADSSAFVPDFLKLSLTNPNLSSPSSTESGGLELSIALPWPLSRSLKKLSSGAVGAISVV